MVEEVEADEETQRRIPDRVGSVIIVVLAVVILASGGFGIYTMLAAESRRDEVTPTLIPSATPSNTPTATPTPTPTLTPTPTPTPLPPRVHEVQEGETLSDIAASYDMTVDQVLGLNPEVDPEVIQPGQTLLIPASTPIPEGFIVHIVEAGETLISIAKEYGVFVSAIRAANDLPPGEETIHAGQSLVIPPRTPEPSSTPTIDVDITSTPSPSSAAPSLLRPPAGAVLRSGESILLQWAAVRVLRDDEWYELSLSQPLSGRVLKTVHTHATAWRVPVDLLRGANADGRFQWRVRVVREAAGRGGQVIYEESGGSSEGRTFIWLEPTPPPGPSPTLRAPAE